MRKCTKSFIYLAVIRLVAGRVSAGNFLEED